MYCEKYSVQANIGTTGNSFSGSLGKFGWGKGMGYYIGPENDWKWTWNLGALWRKINKAFQTAPPLVEF